LIFFIFSKNIVSLFYGNKYPEAYLILRWYGFAMIPMALILVMENFLIAKGDTLFSWIFLIVAPLEILGIVYVHNSPWEIIAIIASSGYIVVIIGLFFLSIKHKLFRVQHGHI
jgi:O-antigen/teichoic acid export membrane protein